MESELILNISYKLNATHFDENNLNVLHLNTRSCRGKMSELTQLIDSLQNIHVIVFSET